MSIIDIEPNWDLISSVLEPVEVAHLKELQRLHYASIRGSASEWTAAAHMACALIAIENLCGTVGKGASRGES